MTSESNRKVVFDALMLRGLIINNYSQYPDELDAFRLAFQSRRFRVLLTDRILTEYQLEANKPPPFQIQPTLNNLLRGGRAIRLIENQLNRFSIQLMGLPQEHEPFVHDAIAGSAEYLITNRDEWRRLPELNQNMHGLQIVTPAEFAKLEG